MTAAFTSGRPHPDSPAEQALWRQQRHHGRLDGWTFNHPVRVGGQRMVLDLAHPHARIAVEVDGFRYHDATPEQAAADRARDRALTDAGWRVYRYSATTVTGDAATVAHELDARATKRLEAIAQLLADARIRTRVDKLTDPRARTAALVQAVDRWLVTHEGWSPGRYARATNRALCYRLGPASERDDDEHRQAFDLVDADRVSRGIPRSDVEDWAQP